MHYNILCGLPDVNTLVIRHFTLIIIILVVENPLLLIESLQPDGLVDTLLAVGILLMLSLCFVAFPYNMFNVLFSKLVATVCFGLF